MKSIKFCFIGHVDSGKSTFAGRLLNECKVFDDRIIKNIQQNTSNSQKWSSLLDNYGEESDKGKTMLHSIIEFSYGDTNYNLIDTPGHKTHIRSMIEGISYFDPNEVVGCLLISMSKGEFLAGWVNGQTKEDVILLRGVGIKNIIVLINKMDKINWDYKIYTEHVKIINDYLKKCKFTTIHFIPVSGYNGMGIIDYKMDGIIGTDWLSGHQPFLTTLNNIEPVLDDPIKLLEKFNVLVITLHVIKLDNKLITVGFKCIMHYEQKEYDIEVVKIAKCVKFIKQSQTHDICIKTDIDVKPSRFSSTIILRDGQSTIGFGKIKYVKHITKSKQIDQLSTKCD
jgi:translation elongation factor EF-1alpha